MEDERMRLRDEREDEEGMRAGERERSPKAKQTKSKKKNPDGLAPPAWLVFQCFTNVQFIAMLLGQGPRCPFSDRRRCPR